MRTSSELLPLAGRRVARELLRAASATAFAALLLAGVGAAAPVAGQYSGGTVREDVVRANLYALADDSMLGRATGTEGSVRAARWIAAQLKEIRVEAGGDDGYYQRIPARRTTVTTSQGNVRTRLVLLPDMAALDTVPAGERVVEANLIGIIRGIDPTLRAEAVVVGAHFDHLGIRPAVNGDSVANGADDDASGVVAALEVARALRQGPPPRRTVVIVLFTGEESGGVGSRYYAAHPVIPLERTVAQFQIEMIGRPDSASRGLPWLTGYDRSTMGEMLTAAGIPIAPDPHPDQQFYRRSDNYRFALLGIPAHTFSSFNLHTDYHRVSDEPDRIDYPFLTRAIEAAVSAVRVLADSPAPQWKPGMRPGGTGR